jgi:hypothetical protein
MPGAAPADRVRREALPAALGRAPRPGAKRERPEERPPGVLGQPLPKAKRRKERMKDQGRGATR